jgi:membrane protein DedA with SNARE-associated domain
VSITELIASYGYLAVLIGAIFEGETILVLGGLAVHEGLLSFKYIILFATVGAVSGDMFYFLLGRYKGEAILRRFPRLSKFTTRPREIINKRAAYLAFSMRFMYGFRHVMPFTLGMTEIRTHVFLFFNILGGLAWGATFAFLGYFFGDILELFLGRLRHYEWRIILSAIALFAIFSVCYQTIKYILRKQL